MNQVKTYLYTLALIMICQFVICFGIEIEYAVVNYKGTENDKIVYFHFFNISR